VHLFYQFLITKLSTPPFKFFIHLKKHITLFAYLLPCPAARVHRSWETAEYLARPSTECSW